MIDFSKKITSAREQRSTPNLQTALESDRGRIIIVRQFVACNKKRKYFRLSAMQLCVHDLPTHLKCSKWGVLLCSGFLLI